MTVLDASDIVIYANFSIILDIAMIELERLHRMEEGDGRLEELERTKRQKMILKAFGP